MVNPHPHPPRRVSNETTDALRQAIRESLPHLDELSKEFAEPCLIWRKREDGGWEGKYVQRPDVGGVFIKANTQLEALGKNFTDTFFASHPEFGQGLVYCRGSGSGTNLGYERSLIFRRTLGAVWEKYGSFACSESQIDALVAEFVEIVETLTVPLRFQAPLINFSMDVPSVHLSPALLIRQLTEQEISEFYGGPIYRIDRFRSEHFPMHEFVIEGERMETIGFEPLSGDAYLQRKIKEELDRAVLSLRTFKEGRIGYDGIHLRFTKYCPFSLGYISFLGEYIPHGRYHVSADEVAPLCAHAGQIVAISDEVLERACRRLADAETRIRADDQIVDAVIGMETLLLAGLQDDDRRGELKYRFSLHYSTMFETPVEKHSAFRLAKDLYNLRSVIAHGGSVIGKSFRVGDRKVGLDEAAKQAKSALRKVVYQFLPQTETTPYKKSEFWERACFGLSESS